MPALAVGCLGPQAPPERWQKAQRRLEGRKAEVVSRDRRCGGLGGGRRGVGGQERDPAFGAPGGRGGRLLSGPGPGRSGRGRPGCAGRGRRNGRLHGRRLFGSGRRVPRLDDLGRDGGSFYRPSGWTGHWRSSGKSNLRSVRFGWVAVKASGPGRSGAPDGVLRTSSGTRPPSLSTPAVGRGRPDGRDRIQSHSVHMQSTFSPRMWPRTVHVRGSTYGVPHARGHGGIYGVQRRMVETM
jgi:hypothetical protein